MTAVAERPTASVDEQWIANTPVQALLCRDLRHSWPRPDAPTDRYGRGRRRTATTGRPAGVPPDTANDNGKVVIAWRQLAPATASGPQVLERIMWCACEVARVEEFVVRGGTMTRAGKPRYRHPSWYKRTRQHPDQPLAPLNTDLLRGSIVHRLYPDLQW